MHVTNTGLMWAAFRHGLTVYIESSGRMYYGTFSAIEREDGGGLSYNITVRVLRTNVMETIHVRFKE